MDLDNRTPFAATLLHGNAGFCRHTVSVLVKGTFTLEPYAPGRPASEQVEIAGADDMRVLGGREHMVYESDYALFKQYADILVWAPRGEGAAVLRVGDMALSVSDAGALLPLPRGAAERRRLAGTYDKRWLKTRWPYLPDDYDWRFNNCAPPGLQVTWLRGDEVVEVGNLHGPGIRARCMLPGLAVRAFLPPAHPGASGLEVPMNLDTLWLDLEAGRMVLVWRGIVLKHRYPLQLHRRVVVHAGPIGGEVDVQALLAPPEDEEGPEVLGEADEGADDPDEDDDDDEAFADEPLPEEPEGADLEEILLAAAAGSVAGMDLDGCDLSGRSFRGVDFSGASLRGTRLAGADLAGAMLAGADLAGADLTRAVLAGADLSEADLSGATLVQCDLLAAVLAGADLSDADLAGARLQRCQGEKADFTGAILSGVLGGEAVLRDAVLAGTALDDADFTRGDLSGATLDGAWGPRVRFDQAVLEGAGADVDCRLEDGRFRGARAAGSNWLGTFLAGADFTLADLSGADFSDGVLTSARLRGARIDHGIFSGCALTCADFTGSDLREARFDGTLLLDTYLRECNLYHADLARARLESADFGGSLMHGAVLPGAQGG